MKYALQVNQTIHKVEVADDTPLLWVLRDHLNLTGTKYGCGMSLCGACTVLADGEPIRACVTPISSVGEKKITTIEGLLATGDVAEKVVGAWQQNAVVQCGYCQSGQIVSAVALLQSDPQPDDQKIDDLMSGNICRCATYQRIKTAIKDASAALANRELEDSAAAVVQTYVPSEHVVGGKSL